ncbi:MAG: inosine/xanthosine triphosphatase [Bacteroidota bacterium]
MKKVIIASRNPVKINCVKETFEVVFAGERYSYEGISVPSGVADQPMSDEETLQGALNRAKNARSAQDADYHVGIEGGISDDGVIMTAFAWVVILSEKKIGKARTSTFELPQKIADLVRNGVELGHADDQVFQRENSKEKDGAVGILTSGLLHRTEYYKQAVLLALVPFINEELY